MIGIRSITYQLPKEFGKEDIKRISDISRIWDSSYNLIRTQRVSLCQFSEAIDVRNLKPLSILCDETRIRWFNVPIDPYSSKSPSELFKFGYKVLNECSRAFVNIVGVKDNIINRDILNESSNLVRKVSQMSTSGKDNFRLGISINVNSDCPFFPFSYSSGVAGFSIALELTQDINILLDEYRNSNLSDMRNIIISTLEPQIQKINDIAESISKQSGLIFKGFDFSLAPIIDPNGSVITILNSLGVYNFGKTGGMFATSYLTNILKYFAANFKSVGFSGVMYSLLEDLELCSINNERGVSMEQLITLSTMCGCGVDMVPVYGKITNTEMMSIYLEVAAISCRLHKPLGVRILPINQCQRNERRFTAFQDDPDFIANTRCVAPDINILIPFGNEFQYLKTSGTDSVDFQLLR